MIQGPVGSPYPGKYACFVMAGLLAIVLWRSLRFALRVRAGDLRKTAVATSLKPESKASAGASIYVATVAAALLILLIVAICRA